MKALNGNAFTRLLPDPVALLFQPVTGALRSMSAHGAVLLPVTGRDEGLMAPSTVFPPLAGITFFTEDLMPVCRMKIRLPGKHSLYEPVTVDAAIMDGTVSWIYQSAREIIRHTVPILPVGAFLSGQLLCAGYDLFIVLHRVSGLLCFVWVSG